MALSVDDASLSIDLITDKKIKKQFIGLKTGESVDFDLKKASAERKRNCRTLT